MDEDDSKENKKIRKQREETYFLQRYIINVCNVLPTFWVRHRSILFNNDYWRCLESKYYYVFYIGTFFYLLFFITKTFE